MGNTPTIPDPSQLGTSLDGIPQGPSSPQDRVLEQTPQPPGNPAGQPSAIRQLLTNFFHGAGNAMLHSQGLPTQQDLQQRDFNNQIAAQNAQSLEGIRKAQEQQYGFTQVDTPAGPIGVMNRDVGKVVSQQVNAAQRAQFAAYNNQLKAAGLGFEFGQDPASGQMTLRPMTQEQLSPVQQATIAQKQRVSSPFSKIDPIIGAQLGKPPDPAQFPQGEADPGFQAQAKVWGIEAEKIKNRMAAAAGAARGSAFNLTRPGGYVTPEGNLVTATAGQAMAGGYVPAAPGFQAMSKQAQFGEISSASTNLRNALNALQPGDAFNAAQVAQLKLAMNAPDEGVLRGIRDNLLASSLNDRQQDYVIWLTQMGERILSLRNIAGMGQGAQDLRSALRSTLPTEQSGSKQFALKKLDAVDNQINQLYRGIPKVNLGGLGTGAGPTAGFIFARDPQGKLHQAKPGTALPQGWKLENR